MSTSTPIKHSAGGPDCATRNDNDHFSINISERSGRLALSPRRPDTLYGNLSPPSPFAFSLSPFLRAPHENCCATDAPRDPGTTHDDPRGARRKRRRRSRREENALGPTQGAPPGGAGLMPVVAGPILYIRMGLRYANAWIPASFW